MKKYLKIFLIAFVFFIKSSGAHAELIGNLVLDPENPGPFQDVTVTLNSYDFDVDSAQIVWTINGKMAGGGAGEKQLKLTTGAIGVISNVLATAKLPNGQIFQASMALTPASVDLLWESPESFVPPFYEGRSLPGEGAEISVTAVPHMSSSGKVISAGDVSYYWYKNDELQDSLSGRGKQTANITLEYLTDVTNIKVVAKSVDGTTATKNINIYPNSISPLFYLYDPVLGVDLSNAITKRFETTKEFTLRMVPYFFSINGKVGSSATFSWALDGLPIDTEDPTTLTLRPKEGAYGSKTLSVSLENTKRILQKATANLNIVFDTRQ